MFYPNGSTVLRTDIGEGAAALQCTTDSTTCCSNEPGETVGGNFYTPTDIEVPISMVMNRYYMTRRSGYISLNHQNNSIDRSIIGHEQFRCNIPSANRRDQMNVNLFINIGESL